MPRTIDRVAEIKKHEAIADRDDHFTSVHRWAAARLIWEEVNEGKSRRALAEEIGKSHTHVRYMFNCWDFVGRKLDVSGGPESLPDFNPIYLSTDIRESHEDNPRDESGHKTRRGRYSGKQDGEMDYTAHGLVIGAANAIDALARNPAYWPLLTEDDLKVLRTIPPAVRDLLRAATST